MSKVSLYLKLIFGWPLSIIAIGLIIKFVLSNINQIKAQITHITIPTLFISILCFFIYFLFRCFLWQKILDGKNHKILFKETAFLFASSELKRYIPGNIWGVMGRTLSFEDKGVKKKTIFQSLLLETELIILGCLVPSLFSLFYIFRIFPFAFNQHLVFLLVLISSSFVFAAFLFAQRVKQIVHNKLLSLIFPNFPFLNLLKLLAITVLSITFFSLGTYFAISSVFYLDLYWIKEYLGFFAFSLLVGYISFLTPMGLGVREGVLIAGISKQISLAIALPAAIFARIMFVLGELLFVASIFLWHNAKSKRLTELEKWVSHNQQELLLFLSITLYIGYFTTAAFLRFDNFFTGRFDLGNMDQTVWNTIHGRIFQLTDPNGTDIISRLSFHADFILILLSPLYLIWSHPKILLVVQTIVLGCGALFIFLLAKNVLKNKNVSLILSICYLLNPSIQYANLYDFHAITLATTFLLGAFYFIEKRKYMFSIPFLILAAFTKEEVWIVVAIFGIFLIIKKQKILGLLITTVSSFIFYLLVWKFIPEVRGSQHFALAFYSDFGGSPTAIIKNIFSSPVKTFGTIFQYDKIVYVFELFLPLSFFAFLSPLYLLFAGPDLFINLLSSNSQLHEIYYQYAMVITPFIFVATVYGIKNALKTHKKLSYKTCAYIVLFCTLVSAYAYGPLPGAKSPSISMFSNQLQERGIIDDFLSGIPARYSIAASNNIGSHLSHRQKIYTIPVGIDKADIIVFLLNDPFTHPSLKSQIETANKMKNDKNYIQVFRDNTFLVFEKRNLYLKVYPRPKQLKLFPLSIESLTHRDYVGGKVEIEKELPEESLYANKLISYISDGLKLYALMSIPKRKMPDGGFPVLILHHDTVPVGQYDQNESLNDIVEYYASRGFLVIKPDYRGNGKSETDTQLLRRFAYPIDTLNLLSAIPSLQSANQNEIFLFGQGLGGEVVLETLEVLGKKSDFFPSVKAAILWAPVADPKKWFSRTHREALAMLSNSSTLNPQTFTVLGTPEKNPAVWESVSPIFYLSYLQTPLQISHGALDQSVPYQWSIELYDDLRSLSKTATLNIYPDENHVFDASEDKALRNDLLFLRENF